MTNYFEQLDANDATIIVPKHELHIETVWAFVSVDENNNEGVIAAKMPGLGWVPLYAIHERLLKFMRPLAKDVATQTGMKVKLIKLTAREDLETIEP